MLGRLAGHELLIEIPGGGMPGLIYMSKRFADTGI